jgi:hypothetical protein
MNPPTTFIVANITADNPNQVPISPPTLVDMIAPTIAMPEMAFEPDISGVCNVGGTFVITSIPMNTAKIKIVITSIILYFSLTV